MGRLRAVLPAEPQPDAQVTDLFPNLGESPYEDWDYQQSIVLLSFMHQRILAAPDETRHIWKLDGPLEDTPYDETRLAAHGTCQLPPMWDHLERSTCETMSSKHREVQAAAAFNDLTTALTQAQRWWTWTIG